MTVRPYGRITPCQGKMLFLAGNVAVGRELTTAAGDDDRIQCIRLARTGLCRLTGMDFGYDLRRWHEFLQRSQGKEKDPFLYRHPYAWSGVKKAIERFIEDPDRKRLIELIQQRYPPRPGQEWEDRAEPPPPPPSPPDSALPRQPGHEFFTKPDTISCPHCGQPLRTKFASQCFRCGADWH